MELSVVLGQGKTSMFLQCTGAMTSWVGQRFGSGEVVEPDVRNAGWLFEPSTADHKPLITVRFKTLLCDDQFLTISHVTVHIMFESNQKQIQVYQPHWCGVTGSLATRI